MVLPQLHGTAPTVQERKSQHFISTNKDCFKSHGHKIKEGNITWRLRGTDGAGNENLPRATTTWNVQSGKKINLKIEANTYTLSLFQASTSKALNTRHLNHNIVGKT